MALFNLSISQVNPNAFGQAYKFHLRKIWEKDLLKICRTWHQQILCSDFLSIVLIAQFFESSFNGLFLFITELLIQIIGLLLQGLKKDNTGAIL